MTKKYRPALGTRIIARAYVVKMHTPASDHNPGTRYDDVHTLWPLHEGRVEGIFIGYRTIKQGINTYMGDPNIDGGRYFVAKLHFEAWLIVEDPRMNPVYVLPGDVMEIGDTKLHETKFFLRGDVGDSNYAAISIASVTDDWPRWMREHTSYLLKDGWREVGWEEWFLAKEGDK